MVGIHSILGVVVKIGFIGWLLINLIIELSWLFFFIKL